MGVAPIPWSAIHEYATAKQIADVERFEHLIREMDTAWLKMYHDRDSEEGHGG